MNERPTITAFDRRRIRFAALITVSVLALFWVFSGGSSNNDNASAPTCVGCVDDAGNSAPSTTEYEPHPPLFVGGGDDATPADPVSIATSPQPNANEVLTTSQFLRYGDVTVRRCSTMLAPEGALLTVVNLDNGQSTTCTNTQGVDVPVGVGMVMHTDVFAEIGDLADAPLPVRVSWDPDAPVDLPEPVEDTVDTAGDETTPST